MRPTRLLCTGAVLVALSGCSGSDDFTDLTRFSAPCLYGSGPPRVIDAAARLASTSA